MPPSLRICENVTRIAATAARIDAVRPLGVLFGNRGHPRHAAMAAFSTQPPQEGTLQQLGVEPVGFRSPMLPRYRDTRGMDHVELMAADGSRR